MKTFLQLFYFYFMTGAAGDPLDPAEFILL